MVDYPELEREDILAALEFAINYGTGDCLLYTPYGAQVWQRNVAPY